MVTFVVAVKASAGNFWSNKLEASQRFTYFFDTGQE